MESMHVFSSKAEIYARYRWGYAPEALQTIFNHTGITRESTVADIGAGTGILTREFVGKVRRIFAVEPNPEMRTIAARGLNRYPSCLVINGRAEATTLAGDSVDLITAAQAVHWFEPEAARREFFRILKPGGWLAICRNFGTDPELGDALQDIYPTENDTESLMIGKRQPSSFYFQGDDFLKAEFSFESQLNYEEFIGSLSTASFAPDAGSPLYPEFERYARMIFDDFRADNQVTIHGMTELYLGQITGI